jgi:hypothetical protein
MKPIVELPNFGNNLDHIRDFWTICQVPKNYVKLMTAVTNEVYQTLVSFPQVGRQFVVSAPEDAHIQTRALELLARAKATLSGIEIREYILDDYLVLYGVDAQRIYLIAIKHHKQAGFSVAP